MKLLCILSLFASVLAHISSEHVSANGGLNSQWSYPSHVVNAQHTKLLGWTSFLDMGLNASRVAQYFDFGVRGAEGHGWTDPQNGKMVVAVTTTCEVAMVQVTDPRVHHAHATFEIPCSDTHDVKILDGIAYVTSDSRPGSAGYETFDAQAQHYGLVQRFDVRSAVMTELAPIRLAGRVNNAVHNFNINTDTKLLYLGSMRPYTYDGVEVFDLNNDPPTFVARLRTNNVYRVFHDLVVKSPTSGPHAGKEILVAASVSGGNMWSAGGYYDDAGHAEDGVAIWDVTDKQNIAELAFVRYSDKARFPHQVAVTDDISYVYINDEGQNWFFMPDSYMVDPAGSRDPSNSKYDTLGFVADVRNLASPVVANFTSGLKTKAHNMYIEDGRLYWSVYASGVLVFDLINPMAPRAVASFDGDNLPTSGMGGSWNNYPHFKTAAGKPFIVTFDMYFGVQTFELELCSDIKKRYQDHQCCSANVEPLLALVEPAGVHTHTQG